MTSQGIDSRISELRDFISYFAPGNIVEYGSFIHKKQPFRNYFEEGRYVNSSRNSGYRPYGKGYDRRYQPTRDKKPRHSTCFNSSGESTPEDTNDSPRSTSESISSPDSNPNPTPRDTDPLPLSPNLDVVKMQLEALSRIPSPIDDTLPPVDGFKLNQSGINKAFKDMVGLERSPRVHVGGKTVRPPTSGVSRDSPSPRIMLGGKGLPMASHKAHPTRGGKGTVRPVTSGKQIPYHGLKMSLSSEDESDVSSASDSDEATSSSDEEISIGTISHQKNTATVLKRSVEKMSEPVTHEDEEDTIVVDDLDVETEAFEPSSVAQQHFDRFPTPNQKEISKNKWRNDNIVISHANLPLPKKSLIVRLKLPTEKQLKPRKSLIVKLQIPASLSRPNFKKRPLSHDSEQTASNHCKKMCPSGDKLDHQVFTHKHEAARLKLEAEKFLARGEGYQEQAVAMLTHSLFHQMLYFCELENKKEESEAACHLAQEIKLVIADVIEQHVSCGNLGVAGLLMKIDSIFTFRALNLQSLLLKAKTTEIKSQNPRVDGSYLNTVQKFTDDFQSVSKKWHDAETFLSRDPSLLSTTRDSLSLFTSLSHIVEVTRSVVPL